MRIFPIKLPIRASSALIQNQKGHILLLKRSKLVKSYRGYWQLPEGKIERKETAIQALNREIEEELCVKIIKTKFLGVYSYVQSFLFIPVFEIDRSIFKVEIKGKIRLSHEHTQYRWVSKNNLSNYKLLPGMRDIFNKLLTK